MHEVRMDQPTAADHVLSTNMNAFGERGVCVCVVAAALSTVLRGLLGAVYCCSKPSRSTRVRDYTLRNRQTRNCNKNSLADLGGFTSNPPHKFMGFVSSPSTGGKK